MSRRELKFSTAAWRKITLDDIAAAAGMGVVDIPHPGWPLGLLADLEGNAWGVSAAVATGPRTMALVKAGLADLHAELVRLFGPWLAWRDDGDDLLPGLDVATVATIDLPGLSRHIVVDVARAVAVLATIPTGMTSVADTGTVLRRLERSGALLRTDP